MPTDPDAPKLADETMKSVSSEALRVTIIALLDDGPLNAEELAARVEMPVDKIRVHLRQLSRAGLLSIVDTEARREDDRRFYFSKEFLRLEKGNCDRDDHQKSQVLDAATSWLGFKEAARTLVGRPMKRSDIVLARTPLILDEAGWLELVAIHLEVLDSIQKLRVRMSERREHGDDGAVRASSLTLCFDSDEIRGVVVS